jgi:hypothetical protein
VLVQIIAVPVTISLLKNMSAKRTSWKCSLQGLLLMAFFLEPISISGVLVQISAVPATMSLLKNMSSKRTSWKFCFWWLIWTGTFMDNTFSDDFFLLVILLLLYWNCFCAFDNRNWWRCLIS